MRVAPVIELTESEMNILKTWSRAGKTPARLMKRAKIIVLAAQGERNEVIAEKLGLDGRVVSRWRRRFVEKRLAGIEKDLPRGQTVSQSHMNRSSSGAGGRESSSDDENRLVNRGLRAISG